MGTANHRHIQIDIRNLPADTETIKARRNNNLQGTREASENRGVRAHRADDTSRLQQDSPQGARIQRDLNPRQTLQMKLTEEQLETIIIAYENLYMACTNALRAGCLDIDGPLYDRMWRGFEAILSIIDQHDWISWYIHDNEMGKKGLTAEIGCKKYKVKNLKTLLEVMNA